MLCTPAPLTAGVERLLSESANFRFGSTPAIHTTNYKVRTTASLPGSIVKQIGARKIGRDAYRPGLAACLFAA